MEKLLEPQIKAMLINKLLKSGRLNEGTVLINEFNVDGAARRVDLALISENHFEAFEIKSEADSLSRLKGQAAKYLEYFDKVTIILDKKHSKKTQELLGDNIGMWEISNKKFKVIKRGQKRTVTEKQKIIDLMTVSELRLLAGNLKIKPSSYKRRSLELALSQVSVKTLRYAALKSIKKRYSTSYLMFCKNTKGRTIFSEDLQFLRPKRKRLGIKKEEPSIESLISSIDSLALKF